MDGVAYSLVVPVYRNEKSIADLLQALEEMNGRLSGRMEAVFVVDGSPDSSYRLLLEGLPAAGFASRLVLLSRNFGSFAAIRAGLAAASGPYFAVMSADLQEPPDLAAEFFRTLEHDPVDVVIGVRDSRGDPWTVRWAASLYWWGFRRFVAADMPRGGVDVFGCSRPFRDHLLRLEESRTSLVGQVLWLGFRRREVGYHRRVNRYGPSAWTVARKFDYSLDGVFAFTDLPIRALLLGGAMGIAVSVLLGLVTAVARLTGWIDVPGYATTLVSLSFFAALNLLGLGVVGSYAWRAYENTKHRPTAIPMSVIEFRGKGGGG